MNSSQAYKTLEINSNSDFEEVKYAYRKLALQHHPDKNKDSESEKKFKIITEAYHFLKNQNFSEKNFFILSCTKNLSL